MRSWACGGSPIPTSLLELYQKHGIFIQFGFGMTETGPTVFLIDKEHVVSKIGSVGKPQLHVEVRIADHESKDVPVGERGELLIKGPGVTPGYWQLPEVTAQTIALDGKNTPVWAHSSLVSEGKSIDEQGPQRVFMLYYANSRLVAYRDGSGGVVPKTSRRFNFGGGEMSAP